MIGSCVSLQHEEWLTVAMRLASWFGDGVYIPIILAMIAALTFWYKKERIFALLLLVTPLVGQVAKSLLKNYFQVPRPEVFGCNLLTTYVDQYSFPSGHVVFYVIFFGLLAYFALKHFSHLWAKTVSIFSILMIMTIGYSRIYLGVHWYLDVVGGYIVGGAILVISILIYNYLSEKKND